MHDNVMSRRRSISTTSGGTDVEAITIKILEERARYSLRLSSSALALLGSMTSASFDIAINSCSLHPEATIARLGPDEWLLIGNSIELERLTSEIGILLSESFYSLVDISHRNAGITISGQKAREVLNSGCPLDLSAEAFPPGTAVRTLFGKAEIVLFVTSVGGIYQIECWRSFLPYLCGFLDEVTQEFTIANVEHAPCSVNSITR